MSDIIIAAAITAIAGIISGLIAWHSQRGKSKEPIILTNTTEYTEYVPIPIILEPEGLMSRAKSIVKKLLIIIIFLGIFGGLGVFYLGDGGQIGILIGLIASYLTIRRINHREEN